jgi:hypothetical protein
MVLDERSISHKYNMVCEFEEENQTDLQNSCARYIGNNAYVSVFADGDNWGEEGHRFCR